MFIITLARRHPRHTTSKYNPHLLQRVTPSSQQTIVLSRLLEQHHRARGRDFTPVRLKSSSTPRSGATAPSWCYSALLNRESPDNGPTHQHGSQRPLYIYCSATIMYYLFSSALWVELPAYNAPSPQKGSSSLECRSKNQGDESRDATARDITARPFPSSGTGRLLLAIRPINPLFLTENSFNRNSSPTRGWTK